MPPLHADDSAIETEPMPDLIRRVTKVSEQKALANTQVWHRDDASLLRLVAAACVMRGASLPAASIGCWWHF